ncbi:MAG TPA: methyltransferase domain-containing protein [Trebonia sp.]|nr:methyltransferase domain-containing protein [Trebonia sp.]
MWDAGQYLRFGGERSRPFFDLLARVGAAGPRYVADLGCGPGNLTAALARRWPSAEVTGVDNAPEMIAAARASAPPGVGRLSFTLGDVRDWRPGRPPDVLVCNAVLQWVPGHHDLLIRWAGLLAPGGWLAFQVPGVVRERSGGPRGRGDCRHPAGGARLPRGPRACPGG